MKKSDHYIQGIYEVVNKEKYLGTKNPRYLSSWELEVFKKFDLNKHVLEWGSEIVVVSYWNALKQRKAKYIVDLYVKYENSKGEVIRELVEIKPKKETKKPRNSKSKSRSSMVYETATYVTNQAKWAAATKWAQERGMLFRVITERNIWS